MARETSVGGSELEGGKGVRSGAEGWTSRVALEWTAGYLRRGGVEAARFEAEALLAHALRTDRLELYLHPDRRLTPEERDRFRDLIQRRRAGEPLAYLLGTVPFMDAVLTVDRSVLIPRPETEELVEWILSDPPPRGEQWRALDLGTGSGAIAVALALAWPEAWVLAVDISRRALAVARENVRANDVSERVALVCSDWCKALAGRFDLVVSNPPYIPSEAFEALSAEVHAHEPHCALDGGRRGTLEIERIVRAAPGCLRAGGRLYLEMGANQADEVRALLERTGCFSRIEVRHDLGGEERLVRAIRRSEDR